MILKTRPDPLYQRLRFYNCYEYLEHRFDVRVRVTVTLIFILWRISWMGTTLYLPAYVLRVAMGWDLLLTVAALGLITTIYTTLGGVRGAVWTDVAQAFVMFAGLILATVLVIMQVPGGSRYESKCPYFLFPARSSHDRGHVRCSHHAHFTGERGRTGRCESTR